MKRLALGVVGALVITFVAALTASPASRAGSPAEKQAAELYQQAIAKLHVGEHREAARLLDTAYNLDPSPILLWNAAEAYENAYEFQTARLRYWQYVGLPDSEADKRQIAHGKVRLMEKKLRNREIEPLPLPKHQPPPPRKTATTTTTTTTTTTPTTTTTTTPTAPSTGSKGGLKSATIIKNPASPRDAAHAYMLSAMHCFWNGSVSRFQNCSNSHAWGGNANFDVTGPQTRAVGNGLIVQYKQGYHGKPYCSVEFQGIVALRRVDPLDNAVYIYLHSPNGSEKAWNTVSTWMTVICHGIAH